MRTYFSAMISVSLVADCYMYRKIENFIRTKYESKRWVMDGGIPDPSTLDDGDDDVVSGFGLYAKPV